MAWPLFHPNRDDRKHGDSFFPVANWMDDDSPGSGDEKFANDRRKPMDVPRQFRPGSRGNDSIHQVQDLRWAKIFALSIGSPRLDWQNLVRRFQRLR